MWDVVIVGGGPAGITAGIYAARKKMKCLLITEDFTGQLGKAFTVRNYPGFKKIRGADLLKRFQEQMKEFDVEIKKGEKVKKVKKKDSLFHISTGEGDYQAKSVIIATGRDPRPLEVPGEKKLLGKGVTYCVTCEGSLYSGKEVAVVGGGNSGLEAALELSSYCRKVHLLEVEKQPAGDELLLEKIRENEKIELHFQAMTEKIEGEKEVEALTFKDLESGQKKKLEVEGVFIEVGYVPATDFVNNLVEFSRWDEVTVDLATCETKTEGLFAAGDVSNIRDKQIVTAAGQGATAAISAYKHVKSITNDKD